MDFNFQGIGRYCTTNDYTSWDRFGRTTDQKWEDYTSTVTTVDHVSYEYDYAGNRTKRLPKAQSFAGPKQNFEYDGLHRLKLLATTSAFNANNLRQEWTLDQLGNWTTFKHDLDADGDYSDPGDLNQTRTHNDVNEIGTISGWFNPTYDAAGNMKTIPSPHATSGAFSPLYDAWNRVVHVDNNTSTTQTNEYDGLNRRIVRDEGGEVRHFYYNQQWQVVEERVNGSMDKQYTYHPHYVDAIALRIDSSGNEHYYLQDANFNVTAVVDDTGTVAERYDYTPYGEVTVLKANYTADPDNQSDIANEYLYTGRRLDPETGLQLNRNRFYASHLGRWVNRDPIGRMDVQITMMSRKQIEFAANGFVEIDPYDFDPTEYIDTVVPTADYDAGDMNLYGYVGGGPTYFLDPSGLKRRKCMFFGHLYIECQDSCGKTTGLHFGPGIFDQPGYYCNPNPLPCGFPLEDWMNTTDEEDQKLIDKWKEMERERSQGERCDWNPINNCWVPVINNEYEGIPADRRKKVRPETYCGCCFVEGTQILMADGSSKAIEKVQIGEQVLSYDFDSKVAIPKTVCLRKNPIRENIIDLRLAGAITVSSTTDHPYWVQGKGWCSFDPEMTLSHYDIFRSNDITVRKLQIGDILLIAEPPKEENGSTAVTEILLESIIEREPKPEPLWILRVGDYGVDWRVTKKLFERAQASGDFNTYHRKMEQMKSQEASAHNHNFFANGVLVHNK